MKQKQLFLYLILLGLMPLSWAVGQEQPTLRERADGLFRRYEYARAAEFYARLADRPDPALYDLERAGQSFYRMRDFTSAETWYAQVVAHPDHDEQHILDYADLLKSNTKYAEAKTWYRQYAERSGAWEAVATKIAGCDSALQWMASPSEYVIRNERAVNTEGSEFSISVVGDIAYYVGEPPVEDADRQDIYGWTGRPYLKIHRAEITEDMGLKNPAPDGESLEGLNDLRFHVGPVASPDGGKTWYVTRTYAGSDLSGERERGRRFKTRRLELYQYTQQNSSWVTKPFVHNDPDNYSVGHAAFSRDGQIIYFVSDRPGGFGGADIWFAERMPDGSWGTARNAGSSINTPGDELFPVVGPDGSLYFSSDGHAGMGGLDIFRSTGRGESWAAAVNMGYPINSSGDDFAYVLLEDNDQRTTGYLSSNRPGGVGGDDIYSFIHEKPQPESIVLILKGVVTNKATTERLGGASIALVGAGPDRMGKSAIDGSFEFVLEPDQAYKVKGALDQFLPDSAVVETWDRSQSDTLEVTLALEPEMSVGKTFVLENLYYDFDQHTIRPDAAKVLDELVKTLREYPTMKIELSSHTDSRGNDAYNLALSQRRAQSAVDYLVSRGIDRSRMVAKGYGETRLVNDCANGVDCTEEQHQANRRTEVTVLDL